VNDEPYVPPPQVPREWWTVYRWGEEPVNVRVTEPQTQREMRVLYPDAAGIVAVESV
jgi:hypothetical protein